MVELLVVALSLFVFAMFSQRFSLSPVTAPMVFAAVGLLMGTVGVDLFDLTLDREVVSVLVEGTLVLVLFTDAARIDLRALRTEAALPSRLLGIGLPLTIIAGAALAAVLFRELTLVEAGLVAAVLAPTDAALGQAVVSDRRLPVRIRQTLNVESGLNDGIMVPVVTVLLALSVAEAGSTGTEAWGEFVARQLGFGLTIGVLAGAGGGWLLHRRASSDAVEGTYRQLAALSVAVGAFAGAEVLGGNGFIAAFVAGLAFARVAAAECANVRDFTEDEGELLTALTFLIFGAALAAPRLGHLTWQIGLYAVASLTVVRVVPVLIALARSGTLLETRLFVGWFGPRGLASILFALLVSQELEGGGAETILDIAVWTVLLSIFAHGLTASWWAGRLGNRIALRHDAVAENRSVPELPTRRDLS
ncbi:sodium:proton exchanger [Aeromicrobium sp. A1-2]|uniref:cation:proton antiporter n=1 Tax=Aeromicrobium sp. A1-2 TaxID=2107713 RepID=UPI000E4927C8|nr:sodium:proton antiporter [Aeromicrobium sp. A1-2]AXT85020.1 sodium:proton exchanger [Aeromicrobium sp. A1-2]